MINNYQDLSILIVDDDPVNLLLAGKTLAADSYDITEAESGEEALLIFVQRPFDLVLLDVIMPGIDGFEVCRRIRTMVGGANVPILIMTGLDDDTSIRNAYDAGATDFITKPIAWSLLAHRVRYMIRASMAMRSLAQSRAGLAYAQSIARMGSWHYDSVHRTWQCSNEVARLLECDSGVEALSYEIFLQRVHPEDREQVDRNYQLALKDGTACKFEHRLRMPDGRVKWISFQGLPTAADDTSDPGYMVTIQDITERKLAEDRVQYLAYYDGLTGLPNRNLFQENLTRALESAHRHHRSLAVLMLNLNRFRRINETFGHAMGDLLLKLIGEVIQKNIRGGDSAARPNKEDLEFVRWTGDEFAITALDLADPKDAELIAQRVLTELSQPFLLEGHEITMTACVGIAVYPEDGNDMDELVKNAQSALWSARKLGPNSCQFYTQSMNAHARQRLTLESDLRLALEQGQLELFYQPLVKTGTFEITGAEALLRWHHPERGLIPPGDFIALAEETELIVPIGEWALATAAAQNKDWRQSGLRPISISVNLSAVHFKKNMLLPHVHQALSASGMDGSTIILEVTESLLMQDLDATLPLMKEIQQLGVRFAIDDFGTGYSSLNYLNRLPVQALKIDRSFVMHLPDDGDSLAIIRAIVALGHSLKMSVVAEGVETAIQAQILTMESVDLLQGYLFSRPVPAEAFSRLLAEGAIAVPAERHPH